MQKVVQKRFHFSGNTIEFHPQIKMLECNYYHHHYRY